MPIIAEEQFHMFILFGTYFFFSMYMFLHCLLILNIGEKKCEANLTFCPYKKFDISLWKLKVFSYPSVL